MVRKVKVGLIGCGVISAAYFKGTKLFDIIDMVACADLLLERAQARAEEFGIPKACTVDELLANPEIELVINLTIPKVHAEVNIAALEAGKHAYCEKPLAVTRDEGLKTLQAAQKNGLKVGSAPDTFLGGGIQTCRKLIDDGAIGTPVAATAFMTTPGHERWHPDPGFYYQAGGGPMFDMGPYYLTALINLLGSVDRVTGSTRITYPERTITSEPKHGEKIQVNTATHVTGLLDFSNGPIGTIVTSFDVWGANLPRIEIYGSEGSLSVPDPNRFDGPVRLLKAGEQEWQEIEHTHSTAVSRGVGVADMAYSLVYDRPFRANGDLAFHVLDIMQSFEEASQSGQHIELDSQCDRPTMLPTGLALGELDQ
ncbi:MAG: Gfo/Idh/MocA family oxidoreductase [Chloroflexota bacterium]